MAKADLSDIDEAAARDSDIDALVQALKRAVRKYGAFLTTRTFAFVMASYKRSRFEEMLAVKESHTTTYSHHPSALAGKDAGGGPQPDMGLDHRTLWQQRGKLLYLRLTHFCGTPKPSG